MPGRDGNPSLSADSLPMLVGLPVTLLSGAALLLGILGMAGEFRHQTVTQTFLVTPDRGRVVAAKLVAYPLAGILLALTILAFTAAVAAGWLAAKGITPSLADARSAGCWSAPCSRPGCAGCSRSVSPPWSATRWQPWSAWRSGSFWSRPRGPAGRTQPGQVAALGRSLLPQQAAPGSRLAGTLLLAGYGLALAVAGTRLVVRRDIT